MKAFTERVIELVPELQGSSSGMDALTFADEKHPGNMPNCKNNVAELAVLGGESLFAAPKSTSNLVRPDLQDFLGYSKIFFERRQYTNDGPLVRLLEQRLADFHQTEFCVAFCNGFWGIVLAMRVLARKGKSQVIMPSFTYRRLADIAAWAEL